MFWGCNSNSPGKWTPPVWAAQPWPKWVTGSWAELTPLQKGSVVPHKPAKPSKVRELRKQLRDLQRIHARRLQADDRVALIKRYERELAERRADITHYRLLTLMSCVAAACAIGAALFTR